MAEVEVEGSHTAEQLTEYFRRKTRQGNSTQQNSSSGISVSRDAVTRPTRQPSKCEILNILTAKPKHRQYSTLEARIKSFENDKWVKHKGPDIIELAEAGLAYTGVADSVRCYYCSIGLKDWPKDACPWEQHILASPDCGHVAQCKGKAFIRRILGGSDEESDVELVDDSNEFVDTVKEAIKRNEESVTAAKQYCPDDLKINKAVKLLIKEDRVKKFSAVELAKAVDEIEKESRKEGKDGNLIYDTKPDDVETDGESSDEGEEERNRKLKEPITCKICFNAIACIITLPCGHMVSCPQCIPALTKCAVCRADIKGTVRALMAV